jgi:hypothetical protein
MGIAHSSVSHTLGHQQKRDSATIVCLSRTEIDFTTAGRLQAQVYAAYGLKSTQLDRQDAFQAKIQPISRPNT